jgi:hypothetical protein
MRTVNEVLPIWSVENDAILSKMGDVTLGYSVVLPEIFSMNAAEYEAFHQAWVKAIKLLPAHSAFCINRIGSRERNTEQTLQRIFVFVEKQRKIFS